jgi:hypothetical protein
LPPELSSRRFPSTTAGTPVRKVTSRSTILRDRLLRQ